MDTLKAEKFIEENARPLEKAIYNYYFGNGTGQQVIILLMRTNIIA